MSILTRLKMGPYEGVVQYDTGGPVGGEICLSITGPNNLLIDRFYFFETYSKIEAKKFLDKVALDTEYRTTCAAGTTKWQTIQRIYLSMVAHLERDFFNILGECFLNPDNTLSNERYLEAQVILRELCRVFLYEVERATKTGEEIKTISMFTQKKCNNTFRQIREKYLKMAEPNPIT